MQKACVKSIFLHTNEKHAWEIFFTTIPIGFSCRHLGGVSILTMRNAKLIELDVKSDTKVDQQRIRKRLIRKRKRRENKKFATFSLFRSAYQQLSVSVPALFMLMKYPSPRSIVVKSLNSGGATGL